jgi:hypothetical protein
VATVKVIAGALVLWAAGVGLGAAGMLAGASVRRGWRRRRTRLVAWGGRRRDVQVGSFEDMTRLCEQLIASANLKLLGIVSGLPVLEVAHGGWPSGRATVDMVAASGVTGPMDVYVVACSSRCAPAKAIARLTNIKDDSRRDA